MPTFRDVPCVYCGKTFTWQNDFNPLAEPLACHSCRSVDDIRYICRFCGKEETRRYMGDFERIVLRTCFHCGFYIKLLTKPHPNQLITPDYEPFQAADWLVQPRSGLGVGFGGRPFRVIFLDDTVRYTNNLWSQGEPIPEIWRKYFPPNVKEVVSVSHHLVPKESVL